MKRIEDGLGRLALVACAAFVACVMTGCIAQAEDEDGPTETAQSSVVAVDQPSQPQDGETQTVAPGDDCESPEPDPWIPGADNAASPEPDPWHTHTSSLSPKTMK